MQGWWPHCTPWAGPARSCEAPRCLSTGGSWCLPCPRTAARRPILPALVPRGCLASQAAARWARAA
eukprot:7770037-Alexandrium_andersonii.AAC.1